MKKIGLILGLLAVVLATASCSADSYTEDSSFNAEVIFVDNGDLSTDKDKMGDKP